MSDGGITLHRYRTRDAAAWDGLVGSAAAGTLFHTRRFLSYHPAGRFEDHSLMFRRNDSLLALCPAARVSAPDGLALVSHPGATFGGLVYPEGTGIRVTQTLVDLLVGEAERLGVAEVRVTLPPIIYEAHANNVVEFALRRTGFQYLRQELSAVVTLSAAGEPWDLPPQSTLARAVRKADRLGVTVRESDALDRFYPVLCRNLSLRHNVQPTHTRAELTRLRGLFPDQIRLFAAWHEGRLVGGVLIFCCNAQTALAYYIAHDSDYQHLRVIDALMVNIIQWASARRYRFLDLGTFTLDMAPNWGLGKFKEKFGARGVFRSTLALPLRD